MTINCLLAIASVFILCSSTTLARGPVELDKHLGFMTASGVQMAQAETESITEEEQQEGLSKQQELIKKMDIQIKAMHEMHTKMMEANTPSMRKSLMPEHMKTMQESIAIIRNMPDVVAMPMRGGASLHNSRHASKHPGVTTMKKKPMMDMQGEHMMNLQGDPCSNMHSQQKMIVKRLQMLEVMTQMMMDRLM